MEKKENRFDLKTLIICWLIGIIVVVCAVISINYVRTHADTLPSYTPGDVVHAKPNGDLPLYLID